MARAFPADRQYTETVFVDDGYPEADEFANNYRERVSRIEPSVPPAPTVQRQGVLDALKSLFGWNRGAANGQTRFFPGKTVTR